MVNHNLVGGIPTRLTPTPLKNDGVRQWEGWQPNTSHIWNGNYIKAMFQTTNQAKLVYKP